jgi:DNA-binding NarL/FixJ family response regulator
MVGGAESSGLEATRRIRATAPEIMVLLMSTRDAQEFAIKAAECGASVICLSRC